MRIPMTPALSGPVSINLSVTGGATGSEKSGWLVESGTLLPTDPRPDADLELTISEPDLELICAREIRATVLFMQGRLKFSGDNHAGLVLLRCADDYVSK